MARGKTPEKLNDSERVIANDHFEYLQRKLDERKLILAGRCLAGEFGIGIFHAESLDQAESFMENDPAIKKGLMAGNLYPFKIALTTDQNQ